MAQVVSRALQDSSGVNQNAVFQLAGNVMGTRIVTMEQMKKGVVSRNL